MEGHWADVHHSMISDLRKQIHSQLPAGLYAVVQTTLYPVDPAWEHQYYAPDVMVLEGGHRSARERSAAISAVGIAEPIELDLEIEPIRVGHIEVRDHKADDHVVTVIEVLSPANKDNPKGRKQYLRKRKDYLRSQLSLVELDLLRGGPDLFGIPAGRLPAEFDVACKCLIRRSTNAPAMRFEYIPLPLRQRLPKIRIPFRPGEEDGVVDLQQSIDVAFEEGSYAMTLDYSQTPEPPLSAEDAAWAAEIVAAARGAA